ncbi:uncharacterized mitochondrial protein AtMg00810-like [Nicotiana tomentosiformis]|uniref:uncharacterized mitochondrial protein AtMg00810-like n=1 Tax=Nicotiana tomentosiformis TaxID=4098 RepID=UPI00388C92EF
MQLEIEALEQNRTWKIVDLPDGKVSIGCKWVYKIKYNEDSLVERFKARLVAKGYTQQEDDLLVTENDLEEIQNTKVALHQKFKLKDLGELRYFLGIEFARSIEGILMSQRKYALEMISGVGLAGLNPKDTPMEQNIELTST